MQQGSLELEQTVKQLRDDNETLKLSYDKAKFSNGKLKRKLQETNDERISISTELDIANKKNEYLADELREALERTVSAEIRTDELTSQIDTLQEELMTNQSKCEQATFELSDVDSFDEEFIPDQLKRILTRKSSKFEQEIDDINNELRRAKQGMCVRLHCNLEL